MELGVFLKDIDFGDIDGREESKSSNFESLFYQKGGDYEKLVNSNAFLILGRKGVGKTILVNYLHKKQSNDILSKLLDINDFFERKLNIVNYDNILKEEMDNFWRHIFLLEISDLIINNASLCQNLCHLGLRKLKKYNKEVKLKIEDITRSDSINASSELSIDNSPKLKFDAGYKNQYSLKKKKYYEITNKIANLIQRHTTASGFINKILFGNDVKHFIIYDDIDELHDKVNDPTLFFDMMNSMIRAARKINDDFFINGRGIKIVLVFRKDIIRKLQEKSSNLNKTISLSLDINWSDYISSEAMYHPLIKLIIHKIKNSIDSLNEYPDEEIYEVFLSQESGGENILDLLLKNSFARPRDVIKYLKIYQEYFPKDTKISIKNMKRCLKIYSEWFYNEFMNEINILDKKDEIIETIRIIQEMKKHTFSFLELQDFIKKHYSNYEIKNLKPIIDVLYELSFIGNISKSSKGKSGRKVEFFYRHNNAQRPNPDPSMDLTVHFGMRPYLSL